MSLVELLGTLPAGLYILLVLEDCCSLTCLAENRGILGGTAGSFGLLYVMFAAYFLGSIPRAVPASRAERVIKWFGKCLPRCKHLEKMQKKLSGTFPYAEWLQKSLDELSRNNREWAGSPFTTGGVPKVPLGDVPMPLFDYWKNVLCQESPTAFEYVKALEARVRFLLGMFWAAVFAVASESVLGILRSVPRFACQFERSNYHSFSLAVLSLVICIALVLVVPSARREEAHEVFLAYLAHLQKTQPNASGTGRGDLPSAKPDVPDDSSAR